MGRLNVSREKYPGIAYEFEHFFGRSMKIHTRYVVSTTSFPHTHDFPQVYYCVKGKNYQIVAEKKYTLEAGEFIVIPTGVIHTFMLEPESEVINLNLSFEILLKNPKMFSVQTVACLFLSHFSEEMGSQIPILYKLGEISQVTIKNILYALIELGNGKTDNTTEALSLVNEIFALPEFALTEEAEKCAKNIIADRLLPALRAVSYMNKNFSKKIHCEDLLKVSGLCRTDFYKAIKKTIGDTYSIYLQKIRVKRAHRALGFSDYSFSYISDMCGFGSPTYFGKCYKKYRGYTPKEERAALKELLETYPGIRVTHDFFDAEYIDNKRNDKK